MSRRIPLNARMVGIWLFAISITLCISLLTPSHGSAVLGGATFWTPQAAVPATRLSVCSLLPRPGNQAGITGQDAGLSVQVDGIGYWVFGDTGLNDRAFPLRPAPNPWGATRVIPNSIATSTSTDSSGCPSLVYKTEDGLAAPLLPVVGGSDEITVWPLTLVSAIHDKVHFFYASISPTPAPFSQRFIGLASFDTSGSDQLNGHRLGGGGGIQLLGPGIWNHRGAGAE